MEENTVELFDYLRVIWKRKIFVTVMTLVCIGVGAGVGVKDRKLKVKLPVKYNADAVVRIGKMVAGISTKTAGSITPAIDYIENPLILVESIPRNYNFKIEEVPGSHLDVAQIGRTDLIRMSLESPVRGVEKVLGEIIDMLVVEHCRVAEESINEYRNFVKKLEFDAERLEKEIATIGTSVNERKEKLGEFLIHIDSVTRKEKTVGDRSAFLNMLYLRAIDKENILNVSRENLRTIQMQLMLQKMTISNLEEYKTEMIGEVKTTTIDPNLLIGSRSSTSTSTSTSKYMTVVGVAGLIISLFIALFIEYIEESKAKRKRKLQG